MLKKETEVKPCKITSGENISSKYETTYACDAGTIKVYQWVRDKEYFTTQDINKKDYLEFSGNPYFFDSLLYKFYQVPEQIHKYAQAIDVLEVKKIQVDSLVYYVISTTDMFVNGSDQVIYSYIFKLEYSQLDFLGVIRTPFYDKTFVADFNADGKMDILDWVSGADTVSFYPLENKFTAKSKMPLFRIMYADDSLGNQQAYIKERLQGQK